MAVYFDLGPGDTVSIGSGTKLTLVHKSGARAKVKVDSDYKIQVERADLERPTNNGASNTTPSIQRPDVKRSV